MKTKLLALALLAGGSLFAETRFTISIGSGGYNRGYYRPAPYAIVQPPCPGPSYSWVDGYYGGRNAWIPGYWERLQYNSYQDRLRYDDPDRGYKGDRRERYGRDNNRSRGVDRERYRDNDRDRRRDHGYIPDDREQNGYGNRFRNR